MNSASFRSQCTQEARNKCAWVTSPLLCAQNRDDLKPKLFLPFWESRLIKNRLAGSTMGLPSMDYIEGLSFVPTQQLIAWTRSWQRPL